MMRPHGQGGLTLAVRLLPRDVRADVVALYGVFRTLDDAVDEGWPSALERVEAVERWCRTGRVGSAEAAALDDVARRWPLPRDALLAFCAGMRHDLEGRRVATEAELDRYCFRVAGTVGLCVTALLGEREPCSDRAALLGVALQRTNVLRDVEEDALAGRSYVPQATAERLEGDALVRDQIARADTLYAAGLTGIPHLRRGRWAIAAAAFTYREILREIERAGLAARHDRTVVPAWRRLWAVTRAGAWLATARVRAAEPATATAPLAVAALRSLD